MSVYLPITDEQLEDLRPGPNVCVPWMGHGCFIHTVPSWSCPGVGWRRPALTIVVRARDEASRVIHALADRIAATEMSADE